MPLVTVVGAIGAVFVAVAAWKQATIARQRHEEQTKADLERRITESFAKAAELLGSEKLATRLGGIYTFGRIASENEREYWLIMETLTAYVRENAPWPPRQSEGSADQGPAPPGPPAGLRAAQRAAKEPELSKEKVPRPAADVQAILTVLGRPNKAALKRDEATKRKLDLSRNLFKTDLRGAILFEANLEGVMLYGANLEGAFLVGANLKGANLMGTTLEGAMLMGASLESVRLLTQEQIDSVFGDENTTLPEGLERPAHWTKR